MSTIPLRTLGAALTSLVLATAALSGCSEGSGSSGPAPGSTANEVLAGSMTELFAQYLESDALTDFERDVLERASESGEITEADYDEAFTRYQHCVTDLGYEETWTKLPNGVYRVTPPVLDSQEAVDTYATQATECAEGTTKLVEALYNQQQTNPDLLSDQRAVAVQCLVEAGAVDGSYTVDDFDEDVANPPEASFDVSEPEANACLSSAGYSIAVQ